MSSRWAAGTGFECRKGWARQDRRQDPLYRARVTLENGYNESFNSKLRDEILNTEIFYTLKEAKVLIERWRHHYNTIRPHSSLGYRPPAPETILPNVEGQPTLLMGCAWPINLTRAKL